jgi:hypothetical protein
VVGRRKEEVNFDSNHASVEKNMDDLIYLRLRFGRLIIGLIGLFA